MTVIINGIMSARLPKWTRVRTRLRLAELCPSVRLCVRVRQWVSQPHAFCFCFDRGRRGGCVRVMGATLTFQPAELLLSPLSLK